MNDNNTNKAAAISLISIMCAVAAVVTSIATRIESSENEAKVEQYTAMVKKAVAEGKTTDKAEIKVFTDKATGIQYLYIEGGLMLIPRIGKEGRFVTVTPPSAAASKGEKEAASLTTKENDKLDDEHGVLQRNAEAAKVVGDAMGVGESKPFIYRYGNREVTTGGGGMKDVEKKAEQDENKP